MRLPVTAAVLTALLVAGCSQAAHHAALAQIHVGPTTSVTSTSNPRNPESLALKRLARIKGTSVIAVVRLRDDEITLAPPRSAPDPGAQAKAVAAMYRARYGPRSTAAHCRFGLVTDNTNNQYRRRPMWVCWQAGVPGESSLGGVAVPTNVVSFFAAGTYTERFTVQDGY